MSDLSQYGVRIGIVACSIMKRELEPIVKAMPQVVREVYLEVALHCYPQKMKESIRERINSIKDEVDAIFLGYGFCQSLKGIEDEFEIPIIMPQLDDCIQILLTPKKYASEMRKEVGTWFMTPEWAELGAEMVIKETRSDRVVKYGKDPLEMAKRLFTHYRRGLFIDTGVGNREHFLERAGEFCDIFGLNLDETEGSSQILREHLALTLEVAARHREKLQVSTAERDK